MSSRLSFLKWIFALFILAALGIAVFQKQVTRFIITKAIDQRMQENTMASLPDGLHIAMCGTGSPFPDKLRAESCTLIIAGQEMYLIDVGDNSSRNIALMRFATANINAVLITHYHSDHIDGIGQLMTQRWASSGSAESLPIYGPKGLEEITSGVMKSYALDRVYRHNHHGEETIHDNGFGLKPMAFNLADGQDILEIIKTPDLSISAIRVDHQPVDPSVGYLIRYKDRSVLVSGDTKPSTVVAKYAKDVDVLVHEGLSPELMQMLKLGALKAGRDKLGKIFSDVIDYHSAPEDVAKVAQDAHAKYLLFTHIAPPLAAPGSEKIFLGKSKEIYSGPIKVAVDGDFISLPSGSQQVKVSNAF